MRPTCCRPKACRPAEAPAAAADAARRTPLLQPTATESLRPKPGVGPHVQTLKRARAPARPPYRQLSPVHRDGSPGCVLSCSSLALSRTRLLNQTDAPGACTKRSAPAQDNSFTRNLRLVDGHTREDYVSPFTVDPERRRSAKARMSSASRRSFAWSGVSSRSSRSSSTRVRRARSMGGKSPCSSMTGASPSLGASNPWVVQVLDTLATVVAPRRLHECPSPASSRSVDAECARSPLGQCFLQGGDHPHGGARADPCCPEPVALPTGQ